MSEPDPAARDMVEEAAVLDQAELASVRQANRAYAADYERKLAQEIVLMLPEARDEALRVLRYVEAILNLELPPPSER